MPQVASNVSLATRTFTGLGHRHSHSLSRDPTPVVTGLPARVSAGSLQIRFGDEKGLEELVEAFEAASARIIEDRAA